MTRIITATFAYHPPDDKPDLKMDIDKVALYYLPTPDRSRLNNDNLEWDIKKNGIRTPVKIYTNGLQGYLRDGSHRLMVARKLKLKKLPVQVIPDNFKHIHTQRGFPQLDPELKEWVQANLFKHDDHQVERHIFGGGPGAGVSPAKFVRCRCSCKARWKENLK